MTLSEPVWARVSTHLAGRFGLQAETLRAPGLHILAHGAALADYHGIYIWAMRPATPDAMDTSPSVIVSTPAALLGHVRAALVGREPETALDAAFWVGALGERVERTIGPSYQGYLDTGVFRPLAPNPARMLAAAERGALAALAAACPPEEWAHSAIQPDDDPIFIASGVDGAPLAAASLTIESVGIVAVGVITHPAARGRGLGLAVVSALSAWALARGDTLRYQTLRANTPSLAIARALGYQDVATALAVRLRGS